MLYEDGGENMDIKEKIFKAFIYTKRNLLTELLVWIKIILTSGLWAFFPVIGGIFLGYWLYDQGMTTVEVKSASETVAVWIMSIVVAVFLFRAIKYKLKLDIIFLIVGVAFLCREIHFVGTGTGVYIVVSCAGVLAWYWRDYILDELEGKNQIKAAIFCMFWSYLVTLLIQRRVFKEKRCPLLPNEKTVHIILEEVTENVAHLAFLAVGLIALFYFKKRREDK
jgi:hypothetical protein